MTMFTLFGCVHAQNNVDLSGLFPTFFKKLTLPCHINIAMRAIQGS